MTDGPALPAGRYGLDDVAPGDVLDIGSLCVTEAMIDGFAELSGDRFEIHMTRSGAQAHGFPDRVAHGLLVLSLIDGLKNNAPAQFRAIASLGWQWEFRRPVLAGDRLHAAITVLDKRVTRKPDRGILTLGFEVTDDQGGLVQSGRNQLIVYR